MKHNRLEQLQRRRVRRQKQPDQSCGCYGGAANWILTGREKKLLLNQESPAAQTSLLLIQEGPSGPPGLSLGWRTVEHLTVATSGSSASAADFQMFDVAASNHEYQVAVKKFPTFSLMLVQLDASLDIWTWTVRTPQHQLPPATEA